MRERQLELETRSDEEAARKKLAELIEEAKSGSLEVPRTRRVVAGAYKAVEAEIIKAKEAKITGATTQYQNWLRAVPTPVATLLSIRLCISMCIWAKFGSSNRNDSESCTIQQLCTRLGRAFETEVKIREALRVNPLLMRRTFKYVEADNVTSMEHLRKTYDVAYAAAMQGLVDSKLDNRQAVHLGRFGVIACLDAGVIEQTRHFANGKTIVQYNVAKEIEDYIMNYEDDDVRLIYDNANTAMLCPPDEWHTALDGGYLSTRRKMAMPFIELRRVRVSDRQSIRDHFTAENAPIIFRVANYLQSTPFKVHEKARDMIHRVRMEGGGTMGVPPAVFRDKPEYPFPETIKKADRTPEQEMLHRDFNRSAKAWYKARKDWRAETLGVKQLTDSMDTAPERYWLPTFADFRGRWYYRGYPNPHGSDTIRSSILFDEAKALGPRGLYWLKVRTAELHGFDKAPLDERARWTEQNLEYLRAAHLDPVNRADAWGKENPVGTFVTSGELIAALDSDSPAAYRTGVPIHRDASCSGTQHFTALFRDETAAEHVNIIATLDGLRGDLYDKVAKETYQRVLLDLNHKNPKLQRYAQFWKEVGPSRDMCKLPVMT